MEFQITKSLIEKIHELRQSNQSRAEGMRRLAIAQLGTAGAIAMIALVGLIAASVLWREYVAHS